MVLRYISGTSRKATLKEQTDDLLNSIATVGIDDYDDLLKILKSYPSKVICYFHDQMGNTILHLIFSRRWNVQSSRKKIIENSTAAKQGRREAHLRARRPEKDNDNKRFVRASLLQVVQYLTRCNDTDESSISDDVFMGSSMIDYPRHDDGTQHHHHHAVSLIRQKSAGGSLPLHMACRFLSCSFSEKEIDQQTEIIQFLIEMYPDSLYCRDMWGNLPLHEACDASGTIVPIEIILVLLQQYPESIRICNTDGSLPLHLAAARSCDAVLNGSNPYEIVTEQSTIYIQNHESLLQKKLQQLEMVAYLVDYWPKSVHLTDHFGRTALQQAEISNSSNLFVIEFLRSMMLKVNPSETFPAATTIIESSQFVDENDDLVVDSESVRKPINPFDDDCELSKLNTTINTSKRSDEVLDVQFPTNANSAIDDDDESQSDFDGVVELAEDYLEVVVDRIDDDEEGLNNDETLFGSIDNDVYFYNILTTSNCIITESVDRFISPSV